MAARDRAAFAEFVTARSGALHRAAYLMVGDVGLAQDLVQQALTKTYVAWPRLRDAKPRPPRWLQAAAWSGLAMTLLYVALAIVPLVEVASRALFAVKISGLIVLTNAIGVAIFLAAARRERRRAAAS